MTKILTPDQRIELFQEINRVHEGIYGWRILYRPARGKVHFINIEKNTMETITNWIIMSSPEAARFYFHDRYNNDITKLRGNFVWQAYYFHHVNPYRVLDFKTLKERDYITYDNGKRIRSDIGHSVKCLETLFEVQQRKDNGRICISSDWLYHEDCYSAGSPLAEAISEIIRETDGGDKELYSKLWQKYEEIDDANRLEFKKALERYFRGEKLKGRCWNGGYVFAASKEWRIKTFEQLNAAIETENEHFSNVLEEFIEWLRGNGINLGKKEGSLRNRLTDLYLVYPSGMAKKMVRYLVEEDELKPSDVYLWWGGEPNNDLCYAFLTLFFEVDPDDIGTPRFDEKVSRNLKTIINIAEKEHGLLSSYREYEPHVWNAIFS